MKSKEGSEGAGRGEGKGREARPPSPRVRQSITSKKERKTIDKAARIVCGRAVGGRAAARRTRAAGPSALPCTHRPCPITITMPTPHAHP